MVHPRSGGCACRYNSKINHCTCSTVSVFVWISLPCFESTLTSLSLITRKGRSQSLQISTLDLPRCSIVSRWLKNSAGAWALLKLAWVAPLQAGYSTRLLSLLPVRVTLLLHRQHEDAPYKSDRSQVLRLHLQFAAVETVSGSCPGPSGLSAVVLRLRPLRKLRKP